MDINELFSIIEEKESYTEETISEVKELLGNFPYFQTGHMILLKALRVTKPEKFNEQLYISGSFIPDKVKLFKFINAEKKDSEEKKNVESIRSKVVEKKPITNKVVEKLETKVTKEETNIVTKTSQPLQKNVKDIKNDIKRNITNLKAEKEIEFEVKPVKEEPQVKIQEIKKPVKTITEEERNEKIIKKSKERHKKIVSDFFIDPSKDVVIIDETTDKSKIPVIKKPVVKEEPVKLVKENTVNKRIRRIDRDKQNELKKEAVIKEEKPVIKEKTITEKTKVEEKKIKTIKNEKTETLKDEKTPIIRKKVEVKQPVEKRKLLSLDDVVSTSGKGSGEVKKQSDVMNDIFSKIRAIKKEMNISSNENPETIDVNSDINKRKRNRIVEPGDKKKNEETHEPVVKDPFKEDVKVETEELKEKVEQQENLDKKVEIAEEKTFEERIKEKDQEQVEEQSFTAKDLFKQHQKRRYENNGKPPVKQTKSKIESLFDQNETSEKEVVTSVPEKKQVEKEDLKEEVKIVDTKVPVIEKKTKLVDEKKGSAADFLLKRIAMKKQKMKIEDEEEKKAEKEQLKTVPPEKDKQEEIVKIEEERKGEGKKEELLEPPMIKKEEDKVSVKKEEEIITKPKKSQNLIDDFINKSDSLERLTVDKEIKLKGDISVNSFEEKEEFMTEAMADLFIEQKYYDKALNVYKKLILKFPQKKTYFAIQIKKVESLIKNK